ncbi:MAG TPA: 30S ribosomal protein S16 [Peptococcaceae bacterium]|nr:MAG: 30S ribosomal protein S16 [Clostridia bacterium 41_269]HBT20016.1 30S ribosomal protein S16 [Peptococcaceae bacterium]
MATKIRLKRMGSKKRPYYRIVVADSRSPRDGKFIEQIGSYDPIHGLEKTKIDEEKAIEWLKKGAQPTDTVKSLFEKMGIWEKIKEQKEAQ